MDIAPQLAETKSAVHNLGKNKHVIHILDNTSYLIAKFSQSLHIIANTVIFLKAYDSII